jgi:hypothetical protein
MLDVPGEMRRKFHGLRGGLRWGEEGKPMEPIEPMEAMEMAGLSAEQAFVGAEQPVSPSPILPVHTQ